eukprot:GHVU01171589.1.p1 GENE.GHVU01171589.1~~GHVU01171589.1.p1  ORF type:complete len:340 (+),score=37.52 GHVU01171589.1:137-1156(+)
MEQQQQQYRQQPLRLRGQLRLYRLPIPSCSSRENLQTNWLSSAPPAAQRPFEAVHTSMHHRPISCSFSHSCTCRDVVSLLPFSFSLTLSTGAATDVTAAIALRLNRGATIGAPGALPQGGGRSGGADASSDNKSHLLRRVADVFGSTDPEEVAARFASLNARRIAAKEAATMSGEKIRVLREAQSQRSAKAEGGEESHEYERRASRLQTIDATLDNLTQRLTRLRTVRSREDTLRIEAASLEAAIRSLADLLSFLPVSSPVPLPPVWCRPPASRTICHVAVGRPTALSQRPLLYHSLTPSFTHSPTYSFTHSRIDSSTHSLLHFLTHSLTHSFTDSLTH